MIIRFAVYYKPDYIYGSTRFISNKTGLYHVGAGWCSLYICIYGQRCKPEILHSTPGAATALFLFSASRRRGPATASRRQIRQRPTALRLLMGYARYGTSPCALQASMHMACSDTLIELPGRHSAARGTHKGDCPCEVQAECNPAARKHTDFSNACGGLHLEFVLFAPCGAMASCADFQNPMSVLRPIHPPFWARLTIGLVF